MTSGTHKKTPHRQELVSRNMSEELQTVFQAVVRIITCVKNSALRGRLFEKLHDSIGAGHTALLYYAETCCLSHA
jgi:hypothetical protein